MIPAQRQKEQDPGREGHIAKGETEGVREKECKKTAVFCNVS
jgi:hypothetical protein